MNIQEQKEVVNKQDETSPRTLGDKANESENNQPGRADSSEKLSESLSNKQENENNRLESKVLPNKGTQSDQQEPLSGNSSQGSQQKYIANLESKLAELEAQNESLQLELDYVCIKYKELGEQNNSLTSDLAKAYEENISLMRHFKMIGIDFKNQKKAEAIEEATTVTDNEKLKNPNDPLNNQLQEIISDLKQKLCEVEVEKKNLGHQLEETYSMLREIEEQNHRLMTNLKNSEKEKALIFEALEKLELQNDKLVSFQADEHSISAELLKENENLKQLLILLEDRTAVLEEKIHMGKKNQGPLSKDDANEAQIKNYQEKIAELTAILEAKQHLDSELKDSKNDDK